MAAYLISYPGGAATGFVSANKGWAPGTVYSLADGRMTEFDFDANDDGDFADGETVTLDGGTTVTAESTSDNIWNITANVTWSDGTTSLKSFQAAVLDNGEVLWVSNGSTGISTHSVVSFEIVSAILSSPDYGSYLVDYGFDVVCFAEGTRIEGPDGWRRVEEFVAGDLVLTRDSGPQALRWVGRREVPAEVLQAHPRLRPIRIRVGALGAGLPESDLLVSPQHRMLLSSRIARRMFGADEVLVAAKKLLPIDGIEESAATPGGVTYYHLLFDRHEIVNANGDPAESLHLGPQALRALTPMALADLRNTCPDLLDRRNRPAPCRVVPAPKQAGKLVQRIAMNGRSLREVGIRDKANPTPAAPQRENAPA